MPDRTRNPRRPASWRRPNRRPSRRSPAACSARLGPQIQWQQSCVTGDKVHCVYIAPNEDMVREHARQGGFPANRVSRITTIIDPATAE